MMLRALQDSDIPKISELHFNFYRNEFDLPDYNHTLGAFIIEDDTNIICAANIRTIAEITLITDKSFSEYKRKTALFQVFEACQHIARRENYNELHVFVQDSFWKRVLKKFGFVNTKGTALVIGVK